jgi:hypothetical protein
MPLNQEYRLKKLLELYLIDYHGSTHVLVSKVRSLSSI